MPVSIGGDPKLVRDPLVCPPIIGVAHGVPCYILRERGGHLSKNALRLEVHMKPVRAMHEGFCHLQVVLDQHATGSSGTPDREVQLILPPVKWGTAVCLDKRVGLDEGSLVFLKYVDELCLEARGNTKAPAGAIHLDCSDSDVRLGEVRSP